MSLDRFVQDRIYEWRRANPDRLRKQRNAATARWKVKNRERYLELKRFYQHQRRAQKRGSLSRFSLENWYGRCSLYLWRCAYCGMALTKVTVTMDHVLALAKGGPHLLSNVVPACKSCNMRKKDTLWLPKIYIERNLCEV